MPSQPAAEVFYKQPSWMDSIRIQFVDGWIKCLQCELNWCEHIEAMIRANDDAAFIWSPNTSWPDGAKFQVPMFPTAGLYQEVRLSHITGLDSMLLVDVLGPRYDPLGDYRWNQVCTISEGEAIFVIRVMLIELMKTDRSRSPICNASHHDVRAQEAFLRNNQIMEQWSIWTTDMCSTCNKALDFSDLVPNNDRRFPK
jgi:hypothetical protein